MSLIFFVGMPGSGKTFEAKRLAKQYNCTCIDLDEFIENKEQQTIHELFRTKGENYFREVESKCLMELIATNNDDMVFVACGGGTPVFGENLQLMKNAGCVIYIDVDLRTLEHRVKADIEKRPLFSSVSVVDDVLLKLYQHRKPYYKQAHYTLQANEISMVNFDKIIRSCTDKQ